MRVLSRALRSQGDPIPMPWPELPIRPGPGDVVLEMAAPGAGKSVKALNWAVHLAQQGRPVLMHSTDTDYPDQAVRMAALLSGHNTSAIEADQVYWSDWLAKHDLPIRWSDVPIGFEDFGDLLKAEVEFLGMSPELVVVDVASDLLGNLEESSSAYTSLFGRLKTLARRFHTTILALHHVKDGPGSSGTSVVKMSDILYKSPGRICQIVLGLWRPGTETLRVAVLKNRMGQAQADGLLAFDLRTDFSTARVSSRRAAW